MCIEILIFQNIDFVTAEKQDILSFITISITSITSITFFLCRISPLYIITVCVIAQYGIVENRVDHISMTNGVDIWKGLIMNVYLRKFH